VFSDSIDREICAARMRVAVAELANRLCEVGPSFIVLKVDFCEAPGNDDQEMKCSC